METSIGDFQRQLAENTASITTLQATVAELADIARLHQRGLRILQRESELDRAEIRRIWEYLLRQNPNGRGGD
ncbi:MAG: hypothetical protein F6K09_13590 [Merismopedia sp. SIO2A8]|nr:hypothetical protein [Symploca sp. SIO2B6]NET49722.1 hypothetical protein [Merismopedia sp. SIO2A8]